MLHPLIAKFEQFTRLSAEDKDAIRRATAERVRAVPSHEDVIREGEAPKVVNLILSGWACRYKLLEDGRRQIVSFFLPGDICDFNVFVLKSMDYSLGTLTQVTLSELSRGAIERLTLDFPRVAQAFWWESLVNHSIQREWTMNLGQRTAYERLGHLFCEVFLRLRAIGRIDGDSCDLPLTQAELADATGLSTVHVNRTLQELRAAGLVVLKGRTLTIPDLAALQDATMFNANYLHFDRSGRQLDANAE